ncbi:hypothetical protein M3Y98_00549000 [Aphelenchoides besseyi]|nr:hypothetical protein M3Y98_00549000 [Aphelenchoides besseyi]KAI6208204.1 hypothetical protein M3Y96_00090500 [Aphelenchoides besseyi]
MTAVVNGGPPSEAARKITTASSGGTGAENSSDYRVAVFGAGGVGKSSIVLRFTKGTFSDNYVPTIEERYDQLITCNHQKNVCSLQITDCTGSHQFPAMQRLSISKGHAFILVYSISSKQSLEELRPIITMLQEVRTDLSDVPVVLVGNKKDEQQRREVTTELGAKLAQRWGCGFIETSAKNNENITELFQLLLSLEKKRHLALSTNDEERKNEAAKKRCLLM